MRTPWLSLVLAACAAPPSLTATPGTSDVVPRGVVMAILRNASQLSDPVVLTADRLPDNLVDRVSLPPGAHVIATLEAGNETDVIGSVREPPDSIRLWFAAEFTRRSYDAQDNFGRRLAFRPPEGSPSTGFCGAGAFFTVTARPRAGGATEFVIRAQQRGSCRQTDLSAFNGVGSSSSGGTDAPPPPLLVNPTTSEPSSRCERGAYGQSGSSTARVALATTASPGELFDHYARQLDSAGWRRQPAPAGQTGTWVRRDSTGRDLHAQLTIVPSPLGDDCRLVTMTATGARP